MTIREILEQVSNAYHPSAYVKKMSVDKGIEEINRALKENLQPVHDHYGNMNMGLYKKDIERLFK